MHDLMESFIDHRIRSLSTAEREIRCQKSIPLIIVIQSVIGVQARLHKNDL